MKMTLFERNMNLHTQACSIIFEKLVQLKSIYNDDNYLDGYEVSRSKFLTIDIVEKYPQLNWDWNIIMSQPNITMDIIEKYIDKLQKNDNLQIWGIFHIIQM